jgi:hypothetical protein
MWLKIRFKCIIISHDIQNESNYPVKHKKIENNVAVNFWDFQEEMIIDRPK